MFLYRVKQFLWYFAFKLNKKEKLYIENHLKKLEYNIFSELSVAEQKHSIRVALDAESLANDYINKGISIDKNKVILAALLHDIGKSNKKLNVIDKSVLVILNKLTHGKLKKYDKIKKVDVYYNHAEIGANILRKYKYDSRIIYLVENHHKDKTDDMELSILIKCDSMN